MQRIKHTLMLLTLFIAAASLLQAQNPAPIFATATSPQLPGAEFDVEVKVGTSANPVANLFGVSFEINYTNTNFVDVVGAPSQGDFMGNDIIFFPNVDDANGKVSLGISRKAGQSGVSGNGTLLKLKLKTLTTTPSGTSILLTITTVLANDPNGAPINLNPLPLTVSINQVLPVALVDFRASGIGTTVELIWRTASETNNYGFEIQRQAATGEFQRAGFVAGYGTTTTPQSYRFADRPLAPGTYFYRLKQIDADGSFDYSAVVEAIVRLAPESFVLQQNYPNPFNPITTIAFVLERAQHAQLSVYDVNGREITSLFNGQAEAGRVYRFAFDGAQQVSGVFIAQLRAGGFMQSRKMLLVR